MSNYDMQMQITTLGYDQAIAAAEKEDIAILSSVVPGRRLHQMIFNPIDSGVVEG